MNSRHLTDQIKAVARSLGFSACGIAQAGPVDEATAAAVRAWLANDGEAGMSYMANYTDKRLDPRLLMPGVKSIVSVALNYTPHHTLPADGYQIASYALGQDYHDIVRQKLRQLYADVFGQEAAHEAFARRSADCDQEPHARVFVDTAPVLERYWAQKAGLGWTGKNHQLIIPHAGSMFFLGELFLDIELEYDTPMASRCGRCHRCVDACPTHALRPVPEDSLSDLQDNQTASQTTLFDAARCLSYQLIENRGEISEEAKQKMGNVIYGCDRCQQACPWNRYAKPNDTPELQPKAELLDMDKADWEQLTEDQYRTLFKGSAVKRVKYQGLVRNIQAARENEDKKHEANSGNQGT